MVTSINEAISSERKQSKNLILITIGVRSAAVQILVADNIIGIHGKSLLHSLHTYRWLLHFWTMYLVQLPCYIEVMWGSGNVTLPSSFH